MTWSEAKKHTLEDNTADNNLWRNSRNVNLGILKIKLFLLLLLFPRAAESSLKQNVNY